MGQITEREMKKYYADGGDDKFRFNHDFLNEDSIVFDIGGYTGTWAERIYSKYRCNIYIFEPIQRFCDIIKYRFSNLDKIKIFDFALSDENKEENIFYDDNASSFYISKNFFIKVKKIKVSDFIKDNKIEKIDLIKLNVEGDEYSILLDMIENDLINTVKKFQIQYHELTDDYENKRNKMKKYFEDNGYKQLYNYDYVWEEWEK
jgi:FkbM family methyltransferase